MTTSALSDLCRQRPAAVLAALGLLSGVLSATLGYEADAPWLQPLGTPFFMQAGLVPTGVFFAAAIALAVWLRGAGGFACLVAALATMYGWSAAVHVAIRLQDNAGDTPRLIAASLAAGAVGAGLTHLGVAYAAPELRRPLAVALTCAVGAVAGLLFALGERHVLDARVLYLVWQPLVGFCIGLGIAGRPPRA
jgi:hypothetical protein